jgi:hypothetical protein
VLVSAVSGFNRHLTNRIFLKRVAVHCNSLASLHLDQHYSAAFPECLLYCATDPIGQEIHNIRLDVLVAGNTVRRVRVTITHAFYTHMVKMCCAVAGIFVLPGVVRYILSKAKVSPENVSENTGVMAV